MDFFQHQDQARRNTRLLIVFFALAVISLIAITTLFISGLLYYFELHNQNRHAALAAADGGLNLFGHILTWKLAGGIAAVVLAVVATGSCVRFMQLRSGGEAVAASLGGQLIPPNTQQPEERKLLNVVEEMAIASGTPVPPVYLLEEQGINAFAAGNNVNDAVIGITRGGIQMLDREQLQGVIAHEFSHILHGDMRINLRLLGVLNGILVIGLIGSMMMRGSVYRYGMRSARRRGKNGQGIALLGLGLVVIGYAGTFFGKLIKAAVSRQREFLADASAVQFTRNPQGIAGALQAIGGYSAGSRLHHQRAEEFSHMYFGEGVTSALQGLMATHPPLNERIRRIDPRWDGKFPTLYSRDVPQPDDCSTSDESVSAFSAASAPARDESVQFVADTAADPLDIVATPTPAHLQRASQLLGEIPAVLMGAAREPFSARAVIYNLLLQCGEVGELQWQHLQQRAHPAVLKIARQLQPLFQDLHVQHRLPLFELTLPAMKTLSAAQWKLFRENLVAIIRADRKVDVFEWSLYRMLMNQMQHDGPRRSGSARLHHLGVPVQHLLSMLSRAGTDDNQEAETAYNAAMRQLRLHNLPILPEAQLSFSLLDSALKQLSLLRPLQKPALLKAMLKCIEFDDRISVEEYELFRAVADCLDCPIPPLLVNQKS